MATTGQIPWPPPGTTHDRHRAGLTTAPGQISMALDTSQKKAAGAKGGKAAARKK
jgi:hypothetical protein